MSHRRLKAKVPIVRSNSLPRMSYPHMASLDVEIDQQGFSSVDRIFPTTTFSPYLAQGEAQSQGPNESNYEFSSQHSAFDVNSDAPTSLVLRSIISDIPKGVSSGVSTLQEERMQTDVAVDLSRHVAKEIKINIRLIRVSAFSLSLISVQLHKQNEQKRVFEYSKGRVL